MVVPGVPTIYAGDEQGFTGEKLDQPHGDDAVRPPFPETPAGLLPYGIETLAVYQELVRVRRDHPWLVDAAITTADVTGTTMTIHLEAGDEHLSLALNAGDEKADVGGVPVDAHSYAIGS
jgi:glycosidase